MYYDECFVCTEKLIYKNCKQKNPTKFELLQKQYDCQCPGAGRDQAALIRGVARVTVLRATLPECHQYCLSFIQLGNKKSYLEL